MHAAFRGSPGTFAVGDWMSSAMRGDPQARLIRFVSSMILTPCPELSILGIYFDALAGVPIVFSK